MYENNKYILSSRDYLIFQKNATIYHFLTFSKAVCIAVNRHKKEDEPLDGDAVCNEVSKLMIHGTFFT